MGIETVADIVREQAKTHFDTAAIVYGERALTYGQLDERSNRVATGLRALGVGPQEHVAFLDKNTPEFFEVLFGAAKLNAVACAVNWRLAPPEAAYVIGDTDATVLFLGHEFVDVWTTIAGDVPSIRTVIVVGDDASGFQDYESWLGAQVPVDPGVSSGPDDVAMLFYSSGTTGRPKGVMLTNGNFFASIGSSGNSLGFTERSVNLVTMPLFHVAGGAWGIYGLYHGIPNILLRDVDPVVIVQSIADHRITHAVLVPAVIQFVLALPGVDRASFESLEVLVYGASPISEEVLKGAIRLFDCEFFQAYGMTETTGGCVLLLPEDHDPDGPHANRLRAAGRAAPGAEIKVVTDDERVCRPGEVGEVLVRSAQNMLGYWKLPEETAATLLSDGWLRTGDAGYLDSEGYLYIHDRVKDMIISGGENIYSIEVENAIAQHPAVRQCAVIGIPSKDWIETVHAIVVP
ncbi:MAG TPA: AMP-binding protein, partial [Acidimicrobiales bacterium]|nr:AMP-binding protein [Acidimicrobiales bacterium]